MTERSIATADDLGRAAYNAYRAGISLPRWSRMRRTPWDKLPSDVRQAWRRSAGAVRACVDLERGPR